MGIEHFQISANNELTDIQKMISHLEKESEFEKESINIQFPCKRAITYKVFHNMFDNKITFVKGLRKLGKSVMLAQLAKHVETDKEKSIIINTITMNKIDEDFSDYFSLFKELIYRGYKYIFIDEACKIKEYEYFSNFLHSAYNTSLYFVITGSSAVGIDKLHYLAGRGISYTISDWTYLEHLLLKSCKDLNKCNYQLNTALELSSIDTLNNFLYHNNNENILQYVKSCIDDTIQSNFIRGFSESHEFTMQEIDSVLKVIAYRQILIVNRNSSKMFNDKYFNRFISLLNIEYNISLSLNELHEILKQDNDINILLQSRNFNISNKRFILIVNFLLASKLISIQPIITEQDTCVMQKLQIRSIDEIDGDSIHICSRSLSLYIYYIATNLLFDKLGIHEKPTIEQLFSNNILNLKGDLIESYIYTLITSNSDTLIVTKYRSQSTQDEIDLVINNTYGIEIKNRKLSNLTSKEFNLCKQIKDIFELKDVLITSTDITTTKYGINIVALDKLILHLDLLYFVYNDMYKLDYIGKLFIKNN